MLSHVCLFATPWTIACQALMTMRFPRQEYQSELPFLPPGNLLNPRIEPASPALASLFCTPESPGKQNEMQIFTINS